LPPAPPPRAEPAFANGRAALALLAALREGGLRHLVLCPGSRSAPLAVAAALLEPSGLRLHTAIDERSAAFFALGLGRAEGVPAAVVTTSGSAVAHLLPAAVEADYGTVPLLLLTADRPARLKGCGANQSVNQEQFLACSCRWVSAGAGEGVASQSLEALRQLACTAMAEALGDGRSRPPGPVHLNLPFEEPLHAGAEAWQELERIAARQPLASGGAEAAPAAAARAGIPSAAGAERPLPLDPDRPGVVVAGPWRGSATAWEAHRRAVGRWQRRSGWPVLADPLSGLRGDPELALVGAYDLLLAEPPAALKPEGLQVLRLGSLPASRPLERWLTAVGGRQWLVSEADPRRLDPLHLVAGQSAAGLAAWLEPLSAGALEGEPAPANTALAQRWQRAERAVQDVLQAALGDEPPGSVALSEPLLARRLSRLLPPGVPLLLANSSPVRDWAAFADPRAPTRPMFGFRGASGIDGTLSIAAGLAEALGQVVLLSGDLALQHDSNGWLWNGPRRGRLTVLLIDNGGGGIFEQLSIRCPPPGRLDFERLFAMPQAVDPLALAAAHGVPGRQVARAAELAEALRWALAQPVAVLRLITDRRADAALRQRLRTMASRSLLPP
jgi:2-succinyl-5-enolpyruvyl-6-hydroxy-3-cyclohexene-1-carboxylate synthase